MTAMSATAAGFGGLDEIVEGQCQGWLAQFNRQLIELVGGSPELLEQGFEKGGVVRDDGLLPAPETLLVFVGDRSCGLASCHRLKAVQAMAQNPQVMPIQLGQQGGIDLLNRRPVDGHQPWASGVIRKPQA